MRVLAPLFAIVAFLAAPSLALANCSPAHTAQQSTPVTTATVPQSTPAPAQPGQGG